MVNRTTHADALHQAGRRSEAEARFREAEQMQAERQPAYPLLYSLPGFQYCDLLLTEAERAAWRLFVVPPLGGQGGRANSEPPEGGTTNGELAAACRAVSERAAQIQKRRTGLSTYSLLDIALDHLTLGRAALYAAILEGSRRREEADGPPMSPDVRLVTSAATELASAVSGLRRAGTQDHLPRGLLTRAWQRSLTGALTSAQAGPDSAQSDLDEAWEIAERGPMRLFMADIHLHRARLFGMSNDECRMTNGEPLKYPWESPEKDLAEARKLIVACGYGRRMPELEDAEKALKLRL
jgi:hypothetical protein